MFRKEKNNILLIVNVKYFFVAVLLVCIGFAVTNLRCRVWLAKWPYILYTLAGLCQCKICLHLLIMFYKSRDKAQMRFFQLETITFVKFNKLD